MCIEHIYERGKEERVLNGIGFRGEDVFIERRQLRLLETGVNVCTMSCVIGRSLFVV